MTKLLNKRCLRIALGILSSLVLVIGATQPGFSQAKAKDTYIMKGSPLGGVKFEHKLHVDRIGADKCETCHHVSKPEKPLKAQQESCFDCHTKPPQAGMKTGLPAAFHNPLAQSGLCIDCHKKGTAQGQKVPVKCTDCHKKENV